MSTNSPTALETLQNPLIADLRPDADSDGPYCLSTAFDHPEILQALSQIRLFSLFGYCGVFPGNVQTGRLATQYPDKTRDRMTERQVLV